MFLLWLVLYINLHSEAIIINTDRIFKEKEPIIDAAITLKCHRRLYTYRVTKTDENGKQCWDTISVNSCWGRCDSNEVCFLIIFKMYFSNYGNEQWKNMPSQNHFSYEMIYMNSCSDP